MLVFPGPGADRPREGKSAHRQFVIVIVIARCKPRAHYILFCPNPSFILVLVVQGKFLSFEIPKHRGW